MYFFFLYIYRRVGGDGEVVVVVGCVRPVAGGCSWKIGRGVDGGRRWQGQESISATGR